MGVATRCIPDRAPPARVRRTNEGAIRWIAPSFVRITVPCSSSGKSVPENRRILVGLLAAVGHRARRCVSAEARRQGETTEGQEAHSDRKNGAVDSLHRVRLVGVIAEVFPHVSGARKSVRKTANSCCAVSAGAWASGSVEAGIRCDGRLGPDIERVIHRRVHASETRRPLQATAGDPSVVR